MANTIARLEEEYNADAVFIDAGYGTGIKSAGDVMGRSWRLIWFSGKTVDEGYLNKRAWSNDTVNKLMAWMTDNQASGEDGAKHFLQENEALWTPWVSPEAAEKIKASL